MTLHPSLMSTRTRFLTAMFLFIALTPAVGMSADYAVVVGKSSKVQNLSKSELKAIYLGDKLFWEDGRRVYAVRSGDDGVTEQFLEENLGLSLGSYLTHWRRRMFSGRAIAPKKFESSKELADYLSAEASAIGILPRSEVQGSTGLREIKVD